MERKFEGGHEIEKDVAAFISESTEHLKFDEKGNYRILLAVNEAVANIIDHAYKDHKGEVKISLDEKEGNLIIKIHDKGYPFDPAKVKEYKQPKRLEDVGPRGLGVYMMRAIMDEVNFEFTPEGNTLTLIKRL